MQVFTIDQLSKNGFVGTDGSLTISALEYGVIWKYIPEDKEFFVLYSDSHNGSNHWGFQHSRVAVNDIKEIFAGNEWVDLYDVYESVGEDSFDEWKDISEYSDDDLFDKYMDVVRYYCYEDCFGSSYGYPSIIVDEFDMESIIENVMTPFKTKNIFCDSSKVVLTCKETEKDVFGELTLSYTINESKTTIGTEYFDIQFTEVENIGVGDYIPRIIMCY